MLSYPIFALEDCKTLSLHYLIRQLKAYPFNAEDFSQKLKEYIEDDGEINDTNSEGQTLLHIAVDDFNLEGVKLLLNKGADINKEDIEKRSPLSIAAFLSTFKNNTLAEFLIEKGADAKRAIIILCAIEGWPLSLKHPVVEICNLLKTAKSTIDADIIGILHLEINKANLEHKKNLEDWLDTLVPVPLRVVEEVPALCADTSSLVPRLEQTQAVRRFSSSFYEATTKTLMPQYGRRMSL